jgi:CDP-diacylglycerol---glycerol-3-phosphate 3-phosphatidyltransferase
VLHGVYAVYFLGVLVVLATVSYAVRVATRGVARSERVGRIGGTPLIGREVMDWAYWSIDPIVKGLVALGITPNMLTWTALVLGFGAGIAIGFSLFGVACLLATLSTVGDILDGQVARMTKTGSEKGELLDAAVDRYTEFAFLAGCAVFYRHEIHYMLLVFGAMIASFMISYASAKAEALKVDPPRGLMRRHERAVYLTVGVGFCSMFGDWMHARWDFIPWTAWLLAALAAVAVIGNVSAILRLVRIGRALR